ncbi:exportin-7-like [Pyrus ussuriensis x Pyrus communis]|uniref:Exportin-7-like n=1 Tax=Pyrus ussuriensis x Pyrus communis TaxID=2448454 RepID=A0A5N5EZR4_9ROSA|nr:exportin-7-like [Pyrus ussuriensis x Pyrus communis]
MFKCQTQTITIIYFSELHGSSIYLPTEDPGVSRPRLPEAPAADSISDCGPKMLHGLNSFGGFGIGISGAMARQSEQRAQSREHD